ncbi:hypothetical protein [Paenisporosarcina sp. NPDC076898]|uniref:hypothetical protein n=1 Tax=unclassified Paenisporosarcina TaxID=2642018 RepID=UPI003CFF08DC
MHNHKLEEFELQSLQEEVQRALDSRFETRITSWKDVHFNNHRGIVHEVSTQYLRYEDSFGKHEIQIHEIVAAMILE